MLRFLVFRVLGALPLLLLLSVVTFAIIQAPPGDYGDYIRVAVDRENADRMDEMKKLAEKAKRPLSEVKAEQAALWINRSFKGEWIEEKRPDGTFSWVQKAG